MAVEREIEKEAFVEQWKVRQTQPEKGQVSRRQFLSRGAALTLAASVAGSGALLSSSQDAQAASKNHKNMQRAAASYDAMQKYLYVSDVNLYQEQYPRAADDNTYSYVWPFSQAFAATNYMAGIRKIGDQYKDDVQERLAGLAHYYSSSGRSPNQAIEPNYPSPAGYDSYVDPPYGNGGDKFYDDNDWLGLDLVHWYLMSGDQSALDKARQVFTLEVSGWDKDPSHPCPGGVFWTQAPWSQDRNTVSNAPTAKLGLYLYQITGDRYYFDWAKRMYDWVNKCMLAPNGLYWDNIKLSGDIDKTQWSYNQGTMIGAGVLFYELTGDRTYLKHAEAIADKALEYYGRYNRLYSQPSYFNAIFFRNLLLLQDVDHNNHYRKAMQAYADKVWDTYRDPDTGLFRFDTNKPVQLLEQAAMVQIYALLNGHKRNHKGRNHHRG